MAKFKPYTTEQGELLPTYLSEWVPEDHLARLISDIVEELDLSDLTRGYSLRGEEAYHPAMLLKLWFYGYATGVLSSRKIQQQTRESVPFRWLCGGHQPDYRTISDFRKNNLPHLAGLFKQIIGAAMELGYVTLGHISIDGSKLKASASKYKSFSRERMQKEIIRLEAEIQEALAKAEQADEQESDLLPDLPKVDLSDRHTRLAKIRAALAALEEQRPEAESKHPEKQSFNDTDRDSRIMETRNQGTIQGYNPQIAVDAANHFIVGLAMSNQPDDHKQFPAILQSVQENTGKSPDKTTADAGYFSAENIRIAEQFETDAYISATRENRRMGNSFDKQNFTYKPEQDVYVCPAGKQMTLKTSAYQNNPEKETVWLYQTTACLTCPFQGDCVKSKTGQRTIQRTESDPIREAMRTKVQSDEGKAIYRLRKMIVEPVWGEMKQIQGFRQFHLRGLTKVGGEFVLLCITHNLRKFHSMKYPKPSTKYKREKSAQKRIHAA